MTDAVAPGGAVVGEAAEKPLGSRPRVGVATKALYGMGSIAFGVKDNGFRVFILLFYNQVIGLPAALVSAAILTAMLIDCLIDPVVGQISDNFKSKWGRRHPFMYAAALPVALSYLLLWNPPAGWDHTAIFWYLVVTAVVVRSFITLYEIPSSSLVSELTEDYDERTKIVGWRFFFAWWGGLSLTIIMFFVLLQPTAEYPIGQLNRGGYSTYGYVSAVLMFFSIIISAAGTHRFIPWLRKPPEREKVSFVKGLRVHVAEMAATLNNRAFVMIALVGLFAAMAQGVSFSLAFYFATYFWELSSNWTGVLVLDAFFSSAIALFAAPYLSKRSSKKTVGAILLSLSVLVGFIPLILRLIGVFPGNEDLLAGTTVPTIVPWLFLDGVIRGILGITAAILITAMLADVVEDAELKTGRRSEGLFFAFASLIAKAVSGVGVMVAGILLTVIDFPQVARPSEVDPQVITNLALVYMPTLAILYATAVAFMLAYRITRESHAETLRAIEARDRAAVDGASPQIP
jgi:Na+/melibiose symporter-like transporter